MEKIKNIVLKHIPEIISVIILLSGITFASYVWSTSDADKTEVLAGVGNIPLGTVYYDEGMDISDVKLKPTATKEEGIVRNITIRAKKQYKFELTFDLYLDILTLPDELKDASFKYELYKDDSTTPISSGSFSTDDPNLKECTYNSTNDNNINHIVLVEDELITTTKTNYTLYLWIDKALPNPLEMAGKSFSFKLHASGKNAVLGEPEEPEDPAVNLLEHITSLYVENVADEPTDTGNGTYYYADSVQLMNDGLDITGEAITDTASLLAGTSGNIRYYGAEGDMLNNYIYFNCETYPNTNCEKWRIIGIVDGKVKIMRNESIGQYSWDCTSTGRFNNNWNDATVMTLLNDGYYYNEDNISYYNNSITPITINFATGTVKGITEATRTKNIIDTEAMWYTNGTSDNSVYPNVIYKSERTGTSTWPGALALAYPSDYGYAADLRTCKTYLYFYNNSVCTSVNWMKNIITYTGANDGWLITPSSHSTALAWYVYSDGSVDSLANVYDAYGVTPVLYLNSELCIESEGDGSSGNPYRISVS